MSRLEVSDATNQDSESPSQVHRWSPYKNNPADFALTLAEHSGFDAVARNMTPPPSYTTPPPTYSRIVQPRLTLTIPSAASDQDHVLSSPALAIHPDASAVESVDSSPVDTIQAQLHDSSIKSRIKIKLRKRSTGFRERLRRTSGSSRSSSASTSPSEVTPFVSSDFSLRSSPTTDNRELSVIQELDSQPIFSETRAFDRSWMTCQIQRQGQDAIPSGTSSIVPTPRRGLSVTSPVLRSNHNSSVNAGELLGRLQSLSGQSGQDHLEVVVSPCSPVSAYHAGTFDRQYILSRSNAITDNIHCNQNTISPLSAVPRDPPTTPTLDGRLDRLPRLATPVLYTPHTRLPIPDRNANAVEIDSGKELVPAQGSVSGRLDRPFESPHWSASRRTASEQALTLSPVDLAAQAPEVVQRSHMQPIPPMVHTPNLGQRPIYRPYQQPMPFALLVNMLCETTLGAVKTCTDFLRARYGPEPPVPEKHVRVRWRCSCGEDLYDDFIEHRPGAASELEACLNHVPQSWAYSPTSSHPSSAASAVFSPTGGSSPLSSVSNWSPQSPASPYKQEQGWQNPSRQSTRIASNNLYKSNLKSYIDPLWLYTCVNEGKWSTKMRHLDVNAHKVNSDKDLALALGGLYTQVNRKWSKLFKLKGLVSIQFVEFELHRNRFADISCSPSVPNPHSPEGCSYEFEQHDLNPPVGSNYLMHLFKHPEDYDDELVAYLRTPKRRDRLEIGTGWGLELLEGFLAERVLGAILSLFLLGSLVFAVTWACKKGDDVQGAFGVAGYIIGAASLLLTWVQVVLD